MTNETTKFYQTTLYYNVDSTGVRPLLRTPCFPPGGRRIVLTGILPVVTSWARWGPALLPLVFPAFVRTFWFSTKEYRTLEQSKLFLISCMCFYVSILGQMKQSMFSTVWVFVFQCVVVCLLFSRQTSNRQRNRLFLFFLATKFRLTFWVLLLHDCYKIWRFLPITEYHYLGRHWLISVNRVIHIYNSMVKLGIYW